MPDFWNSFLVRAVRRFLLTPLLSGVAATVVFYLTIPRLPVGRELLTRYCCSHPLEYALSALFFSGLAIIAAKAVRLKQERDGFEALTELGPTPPSRDSESAVEALRTRIDHAPDVLDGTIWDARVRHLLAFFRSGHAQEELGGHLNYLSDSDANRLQESHSLLQTVIWSIPILGFLGTVMGITLAIANVTPEQLETSLNDVTGGLAVAFDTTALALLFSLVLGFASLFIKRSEEHFLDELDEHCRLEVHRCFPATQPTSSFAAVEAESADAWRERTRSLMEQQTAAWSDTLQTLQDTWTKTLTEQRERLGEQLQRGVDGTLATHAEGLEAVRTAEQQRLDEWRTQLAADLAAVLDQRRATDERMAQSMQDCMAEFVRTIAAQSGQQSATADRVAERFDHLAARLDQHAQLVLRQFESLSDALAAHGQAQLQQAEQLERLSGARDEVLQLEQQLSSNLETLRDSEAFTDTLHTLNAAVHLLATRVERRGAA